MQRDADGVIRLVCCGCDVVQRKPCTVKQDLGLDRVLVIPYPRLAGVHKQRQDACRGCACREAGASPSTSCLPACAPPFNSANSNLPLLYFFPAQSLSIPARRSYHFQNFFRASPQPGGRRRSTSSRQAQPQRARRPFGMAAGACDALCIDNGRVRCTAGGAVRRGAGGPLRPCWGPSLRRLLWRRVR